MVNHCYSYEVLFHLQSASVTCQDKWCHTAVDANTWVSLVSVQLLLQSECVSVCGRRSGLRYQLPNTLPPLLPFHTGMFRIWMQERLSVWATSPSVDYLWAAPVLTVLSSEWRASASARCPPCCVSVCGLSCCCCIGHKRLSVSPQECLSRLTTLSVLVLLCLVRSCLCMRLYVFRLVCRLTQLNTFLSCSVILCMLFKLLS